jgi:hypothetical protein
MTVVKVKCVVMTLLLTITDALREVAATTMVVVLQILTASPTTVSNVLKIQRIRIAHLLKFVFLTAVRIAQLIVTVTLVKFAVNQQPRE